MLYIYIRSGYIPVENVARFAFWYFSFASLSGIQLNRNANGHRGKPMQKGRRGTHTHSLIASSWNNVISFCAAVGSRMQFAGVGIADVAWGFCWGHGDGRTSLLSDVFGASLAVCFADGSCQKGGFWNCLFRLEFGNDNRFD